MGLFEPGTGSADGAFVGTDEKSVLIVNKVAFPINKVVTAKSGNPQFDDQYLVETILPGSDDARVIGFAANSVPNRAAGLQAIIELIDQGKYKPITVRLVRDDKAVLIEEVK